jgi:cyanobactin maturation PatA/PatG family protease
VDVQGARTGLRAAGNYTYGAPAVCVAVLDGPVDLSHPCFAGASIRQLDTLVTDPAGQGPMSVHGTHVASLIFGQPDSPVVGMAPRCRGLIAPVFWDSGERHLSQLDLARAIEQAVHEGAHVINVSGGEPSPDGQAEGMLQRALRLCEDNNVLVVAAVGNDGCPCLQVPAAIPSVLGVGALGADGKPLDTSNWGEAYRSNGILAPGENIRGAAPGGGTASLTGSSFATPIVSGAAALLLSAQVQEGIPPDPRAAGDALLGTALPCQPRDSAECRRHLAGILNLPGAQASVSKGGDTSVTGNNTTDSPGPAPGWLTPETDQGTQESSGAGIVAAPGPAASRAADRHAVASDQAPAVHPARSCPARSAQAEPAELAAPGDCGCAGGARRSYVFGIGVIGFDFGTEARRDTFRQLMPRPQLGGDNGEASVTVPPNPYDVRQLVDYLDVHKAESTKLIWTLNLDLTPIYAIEAELAYAEDVYEVLRSALRNQALPADNTNYVSRVSIPGVLTNRTRRLFSGQVVPVVIAQARGLYTWNETQLIDAIVNGVQQMNTDTQAAQVRLIVRNYLDKIYYQLRNLGQSSADRALNYAATNAFIFAEGVQQGLLSAQNLPGGQNLYTLDTINIAKSPYCRVDSDCWDVQVTFFDPENDRRARCVYQYTIDVSDEMPVSLAPTHSYFITS